MAQKNVEYTIRLRDKFTKNLKNANRTISQMEKNTGALASTFSSFLPMLGAAGIGMGVKSVISLGIEMEKTRVAFATFLKSGEKANKLIAELNEFANVTPFNNQEVIKSGRVLLAANIPAEKIRETLKGIGDVAAGANVPLTDMAAIYSKAMNKGKVQAEELNQLAERGVPILQTFGDMFGVSTQKVMEMGSQGKLTSDLLTQAFQKMTGDGGIFFNMMDKQSQTLGGKISTLQGKFQLLGSSIGENNESIKGLVDKLIGLADTLVNNQKSIEKFIKIAANALKIFVLWKTTMFLYTKAVKVATIANKLYRLAIIAQNRGIKSAIALTKGLNTAMKANVIGLVVTALGFLVTKLAMFKKEAGGSADEMARLNAEQDAFQRKLNLEKINKFLKEGGFIVAKQLEGINEKINTIDETAGNKLLGIVKTKSLEELRTISELISDELVNAQRQLANIKENAKGQGGSLFEMVAGDELRKTISVYDKVLKSVNQEVGKFNKQTGVGAKTIQQTKQETKITSRSPKVININIQKLIETQNIETNTLTEGTSQIKKIVTETILDALNDTQLAYKAG